MGRDLARKRNETGENIDKITLLARSIGSSPELLIFLRRSVIAGQSVSQRASQPKMCPSVACRASFT